MIENRLISYDELKEKDHPLAGKPISELNLPEITPLSLESTTIGECLDFLRTYPAVPLQKDGKLISVVFQKKMLAGLVDKKLNNVFVIYIKLERFC